MENKMKPYTLRQIRDGQSAGFRYILQTITVGPVNESPELGHGTRPGDWSVELLDARGVFGVVSGDPDRVTINCGELIPFLGEPAAPYTMKGEPAAKLIERFFGKLDQWPTEPGNHRNWLQSQIVAICEHISATGDCLWHAQTVVMGWANCHCANCMRPVTK